MSTSGLHLHVYTHVRPHAYKHACAHIHIQTKKKYQHFYSELFGVGAKKTLTCSKSQIVPSKCLIPFVLEAL